MENNNFEQTPENQARADFSIDKDIPVVEASPQKNNKLPIILIICVLAIALIACIVLFILKGMDSSKTPETNTTEAAVQDGNLFLDEFYNEVLQEVITDESGSEISREEYITQIQQQIQEATTIINQNVGVTSPNKIEEETTSATITQAETTTEKQTETTTVNQQAETTSAKQQAETTTEKQTETTTVNPLLTEKADAQMKAFFDRSFYLQGALYTGGTGDPIHMSLDKDNYEIITNLDGTEISFLKIDGKMYLKRMATNQYVELSESFFNALGIDPGMMNFNFGDVTYESIRPNIKTTEITINDNPGICYSYENNDQLFKFYTEKDELKQIEIFDADGTLVSEFAIDYFSESIPADQLTLKGYEKTGIGAMFADLL